MPTVRYGQRQVGPRPIAGTQKTAAETPESLGAGVARARERRDETLAQLAGNAFQITSEQAVKMATEQTRRINDFTVLGQKNAYTDANSRYLYDPQHGAFRQTGENARGLEDDYDAFHEKLLQEIQPKLKNRAQQDAFAHWVADEHARTKEALQRHALNEETAGEDKKIEASVSNGIVRAVGNANNWDDVGAALGDVERDIRTYAAHKGMGADQVDAWIAKVRNQTHEAVIDQLLAENKPDRAKDYYAKLRDQITDPDATKRLTVNLEKGGIDQLAQDITDQITAATKDEAERDKMVRERTKGNQMLRDETQRRVDYENAKMKQRDHEAEETAIGQVYDILRKHKGDTRFIPPDLYNKVRKNLPSIITFANNLRDDHPVVHSNMTEWYNLRKMMVDDREQFQALHLETYSDRLSTSDLQQFMDWQQVMRDPTRDKAALQNASVDAQLFTTVATTAGIKVFDLKTDEEKAQVGKLQNTIEREIVLDQEAKKRVLTREEKEVIAKRVVGRHVMQSTYFGMSSREVVAATVLEKDAGNYYVPIASVPKQNIDEFINTITFASKPALQQSLKAAGRDQIVKTYKDRIERAYAALLIGASSDEIDAILTGEPVKGLTPLANVNRR